MKINVILKDVHINVELLATWALMVKLKSITTQQVKSLSTKNELTSVLELWLHIFKRKCSLPKSFPLGFGVAAEKRNYSHQGKYIDRLI